MEYIELICSLESKLTFISICSIQIRSLNGDNYPLKGATNVSSGFYIKFWNEANGHYAATGNVGNEQGGATRTESTGWCQATPTGTRRHDYFANNSNSVENLNRTYTYEM